MNLTVFLPTFTLEKFVKDWKSSRVLFVMSRVSFSRAINYHYYYLSEPASSASCGSGRQGNQRFSTGTVLRFRLQAAENFRRDTASGFGLLYRSCRGPLRACSHETVLGASLLSALREASARSPQPGLELKDY